MPLNDFLCVGRCVDGDERNETLMKSGYCHQINFVLFLFTFSMNFTCALFNGHSFNAHTQQIVLHIFYSTVFEAYSFFICPYSTYIQQATHLTNFPAAKNFFSPINLLLSHRKEGVGIELDSNSREKTCHMYGKH